MCYRVSIYERPIIETVIIICDQGLYSCNILQNVLLVAYIIPIGVDHIGITDKVYVSLDPLFFLLSNESQEMETSKGLRPRKNQECMETLIILSV